MPQYENKTALIVVRTYPTPAKKGAEVSCTAAITDSGEWLRIFPVPWRYLDEAQQFHRYEWIELTIVKSSDSRPESYRLASNGIRRLRRVPNWKQRRETIDPLRAHCLCCLKATCDKDGHPTLGLFKPRKIVKLTITPEDNSDWTAAQIAILEQGHLFAKKPTKRLEKIPLKFQYEFFCDHDTCTGHKMICTDWEMAEAWRRWKNAYGPKWEEKFRQRFEKDMIEKYDTHFFVGTMHGHPGTWIIVGLYYPSHELQGTLSLAP